MPSHLHDMTEAQWQLVVANRGIAYHLLRTKLGIAGPLADDLYSDVLLAPMIRCAQLYDPDAGWTFSAYFTRAFWNAMKRHWSKAQRHKDRTCPLDGVWEDDQTYERTEASEEPDTSLEVRAEAEWWLGFLPPRMRKVVRLRLAEKSMEEIGREMGYTASRACHVYAESVQRLRELARKRQVG